MKLALAFSVLFSLVRNFLSFLYLKNCLDSLEIIFNYTLLFYSQILVNSSAKSSASVCRCECNCPGSAPPQQCTTPCPTTTAADTTTTSSESTTAGNLSFVL